LRVAQKGSNGWIKKDPIDVAYRQDVSPLGQITTDKTQR